ncbi:MAG TPA: YjjG family noncanonical pyrimidine nucleotidase [Bacteroidia bacterium]|nr:YjjG family noncanonical pyrimidine nucleotidase [Bacteroidia bacterium]
MADLKSRKHLFFDLDDTLWDFEKNSSLVLQELFLEFALEEKIKTDFSEFFSVYKTINHGLWADYRNKQIDKEFLRNNRFDLAFRAFDHHNRSESLQLNEQYLLRAPKGKLLKEGCLDVLQYLQKKYTLHIITNGFKEVQQVKIDGTGLRQFFSHIIISEEHGSTKPDKKIFTLAETLAGATKEDCVMIGDNFECDILGAADAGWESIYFSETAHDFKGNAIGSLQELKNFF